MAQIVLAIGTGHGPMLALEPELWMERAKEERQSTGKIFNRLDGSFSTYEELLSDTGEAYADKVTLEHFAEQKALCTASLDRIADALEEAAPDYAVLIGNDQMELFNEANLPALSIYYGDVIKTYRRRPEGMPRWRQMVSRAYGMDKVREYAGAPAFARSLIEALNHMAFDIGGLGSVPDPEKLGFGHAYGYVFERLYRGRDIPTAPVLINTMFPPSTPTPRRCFAFGAALRKAVEAFPEDKKVAVIASGGLSHFICEEAFDRKVLGAILEKDAETLAALPENALLSGSSETRSWIALAGALGDLANQWSEYVPIHRTHAGTGQGMAFSVWS